MQYEEIQGHFIARKCFPALKDMAYSRHQLVNMKLNASDDISPQLAICLRTMGLLKTDKPSLVFRSPWE